MAGGDTHGEFTLVCKSDISSPFSRCVWPSEWQIGSLNLILLAGRGHSTDDTVESSNFRKIALAAIQRRMEGVSVEAGEPVRGFFKGLGRGECHHFQPG